MANGNNDMKVIEMRLKIIEGLRERIPPLPGVLKSIINLTMYEDVSVSKIAEEIAKEPELAGEILSFANSRLFSVLPASSLEHAICLLGTYNISRIAIAFWAKKLQSQKSLLGYSQRKNELAIQSFVGAYASKRICDLKLPSYSPVCFAAATLRNMGKIILDFYIFSEKQDIISQIFSGRDMREAEEAVLGLSFPEINYIIAENWGLPDDIKIPVRFFKKPDSLPNSVPDYIKLITYVVHVGDMISQMTGVGVGFDNMLDRFSKEAYTVLRIDEDIIEAILSETFMKIDSIVDEFFVRSELFGEGGR